MATPGTPDAASAEPSEPVSGVWGPDILDGYERLILPLDAAPAPCETPDPLCATLVRKSGARRHARAVLMVHGWNDYFFHTHVVDWFDERGFTVYGIDLRRYGRSHAAGQLAGYVDALEDYFDDLDAALAVIEAEHAEVVALGHSTGGLTVSLWADARPGRLAGVVLNSPWLDMWGSPALGRALRTVLDTFGRRDPYAQIPLTEGDSRYAQAMHQRWGGEWEYSLELKSPNGVPIRFGWVRAVLAGHEGVARGLAIDCPVFVATSTRSYLMGRLGKKARTSDTVLDVSLITARAWRLGRLVTIARIPEGTHDLFLSGAKARRRLFADLEVWLDAYVPGPRA